VRFKATMEHHCIEHIPHYTPTTVTPRIASAVNIAQNPTQAHKVAAISILPPQNYLSRALLCEDIVGPLLPTNTIHSHVYP
jgi:hypothetical protein